MLRGLKICFWMLLAQVYSTFLVSPLHVVGLAVFVVIFVPLAITLSVVDRSAQNRALKKVLPDPRVPPFIRSRLVDLLDIEDLAEISGHAAHRIHCWECHHDHGCSPPANNAPLDHGCHRGTCPYERKK